jgi:iron complex transport system substrate-binding protein
MPLRVRDAPERIVCLTEEPTETLYLLGEGRRVVGISAYTERPPEARRDKPVVSAFIGGSVEKIRALEPDLVIGFSDIQAELARDLIAHNLQVLIFNQRSVQEILDVILVMGRLVGAEPKARALVDGYLRKLAACEARAARRKHKPRVYFEEWDQPTITAIQWVSELIELAGGTNVFADRAVGKLASQRFVGADEIVAADPEVVLGCWCGKPFDRDAFLSRPGFAQLAAARSGRIHELDPAIILQPGPACLSDGLDALERLLA